jgi:hypothetical protein
MTPIRNPTPLQGRTIVLLSSSTVKEANRTQYIFTPQTLIPHEDVYCLLIQAFHLKFLKSNEDVPDALNGHQAACGRSDHLGSVRPVSLLYQSTALVADKASIALWNKGMTAPSGCILPCTGDIFLNDDGDYDYGMNDDHFTTSMVTKRKPVGQTTLIAVPEPPISRKIGRFTGRKYPLPMRLRRPAMMA